MPRVPLIALKAHPYYDGRRLRPGDRFLARGVSDATLLKALGVAADAPKDRPPPVMPVSAPVPPPEPPEPAPPDPVPVEDTPVPEAPPADPSAPDQEDQAPPRRRTYRRRDLVAEDPDA